MYILPRSLQTIAKMPLVNARYCKADQFGNHIFIASKAKEPEAFELLSKYYDKLVAKNYGTYLPIYRGEGYCTIRFKRLNSKMTPRDTYAIVFDIKQSQSAKNGKFYANCYTNSIRMLKEAEPMDDGVMLDLE